MTHRKRLLAIAFFFTVLYGFVAVYLGGPAWTAWSGDIWSRGLLVMLAALAVTSLANVWAQAVCKVGDAPETQRVNTVPASIESRGARDV